MVHGIYRPWMGGPQRTVVQNNYIFRNNPQCHHTGNGSFWGGFLGGLLGGGLFSQGGLFPQCGIFGYGFGTPMFGGSMYNAIPSMQNYMSPYAYLNSQQLPASPSNPMENLKQIAKSYKYEIIQNPDGTFTAYNKNKDAITGTYEEVRDKLIEAETEPVIEVEEDPPLPQKVDPEIPTVVDTDTSAVKVTTEDITKAYQSGQCETANEEVQDFNDLQEEERHGATLQLIKTEGDDFAKYLLTTANGDKHVAATMTAVRKLLEDLYPSETEPEEPKIYMK